MDYRLDDLGWFDFERLVQTLLKLQLGAGVEAWGERGDWGRDAFYTSSLQYPGLQAEAGPFVFQCKFVEGANAAGARPAATLMKATQAEARQIERRLSDGTWLGIPKHYALLTNAPLPPADRVKIETIFQAVMPGAHIHLHGGGDVCAWVAGNAASVIRAFPQLLSLRDLGELLASVADRETVNRSATAIEKAQESRRVFVPTRAYHEALDRLSRYGFVVLEGPPEMGKTTIGRVIALSQLAHGWDAIECQTPEECLRMHDAERRQVFVADDFFGRGEYDASRVSRWQAELPHILPRLDASHWLILTSRAHLLKAAKPRLDIDGQNHRFPDLGEVVVNAANLTPLEKGLILYRHARNGRLSPEGTAIVRNSAELVVNDHHFTPERIRRLINETIPTLLNGERAAAATVERTIAEALANPTKQMRVTFRNLELAQQWLLFALVPADSGNQEDLKKRFDALCPTENHRDFAAVLDETSEAFVKKRRRAGMWETVDWIHPSCRDLAIKELSVATGARQHFLENCGVSGLTLAMSLGGGSDGSLDLPLLRMEADWGIFERRAEHLIKESPTQFITFWHGCAMIANSVKEKAALKPVAERLLTLLKNKLLTVVGEDLSDGAYRQQALLRSYLAACSSCRFLPRVDLRASWRECLSRTADWLENLWNLWEDSDEPDNFLNYLEMVETLKLSDREKKLHNRLICIICMRFIEGYRQTTPDIQSDDDYSPKKFGEIAEELAKLSRCFLRLSERISHDGGLAQRMEQIAEDLNEQSGIADDAKTDAEERETNSATYREIEFEDDTPSLKDLFRDL